MKCGSKEPSVVNITESAVSKLREMQEEVPDKGAFRVIFKGFG
jgi:hypothetical protein